MFSIEAMLTVPLSLTIFIQGIVYLQPIQMNLEKQTAMIAAERMTREKNQRLYVVDTTKSVTGLEVNPQKVQEIISLTHDFRILISDTDN